MRLPFPWSMIVGFVLLAVGVGVVIAGVLVTEADRLVDIGLPIIGTALGMLSGKGLDTVQGKRSAVVVPAGPVTVPDVA